MIAPLNTACAAPHDALVQLAAAAVRTCMIQKAVRIRQLPPGDQCQAVDFPIGRIPGLQQIVIHTRNAGTHGNVDSGIPRIARAPYRTRTNVERSDTFALQSDVTDLSAFCDVDLAHCVGEAAGRMERNIVLDHSAPAVSADHDCNARIRACRGCARDEQ